MDGDLKGSQKPMDGEMDQRVGAHDLNRG